jgi:hypothetical protein
MTRSSRLRPHPAKRRPFPDTIAARKNYRNDSRPAAIDGRTGAAAAPQTRAEDGA